MFGTSSAPTEKIMADQTQTPLATSILGRFSLFAFNPTPVTKVEKPLRVGILGAARIAPNACIRPISVLPTLKVVAVAARDKERAQEFARKHNIPKVFDSYEELVNSDEVDVVYIPSPNGLHLQHTLMALKAGKHVMCEKPLASNAEEAQLMTNEAKAANKILFEAFHERYHPLSIRVQEITKSDEIGELEQVECNLVIPGIAFAANDIRFDYNLAGGTLMDLGCYAVNNIRRYVGTEPTQVLKVNMDIKPTNPQIDYTTTAELQFPSPTTPDKFVLGKFNASLNGGLFSLSLNLKITGKKGIVEASNILGPSIYHSIKVTDRETGRSRNETAYGQGRLTGATSYTFMWQAFSDAVFNNKPFVTDGNDGVLNMRVIDMIYTKAGLKLRSQPTPK